MVLTILKYESMGNIIPYIMENKECLKPPTSSCSFSLQPTNQPTNHPIELWLLVEHVEILSGWWYTYHSEKYESQLGLLIFPIYGKTKNVPNQQPAILDGFPLFFFPIQCYTMVDLTVQKHYTALLLPRSQGHEWKMLPLIVEVESNLSGWIIILEFTFVLKL